MNDITKQLDEARLGMTLGIDVLLEKAKTEIERLQEENNDAHSVIRTCVETEEQLRAEIGLLRAQVAEGWPRLTQEIAERDAEIERLRAKGEQAALAFVKRREQLNAENSRLRERIAELEDLTHIKGLHVEIELLADEIVHLRSDLERRREALRRIADRDIPEGANAIDVLSGIACDALDDGEQE